MGIKGILDLVLRTDSVRPSSDTDYYGWGMGAVKASPENQPFPPSASLGGGGVKEKLLYQSD